MGKFIKVCESCGLTLFYEYKDNDKDKGRKRLGEYKCIACSRDYTPELAKELFGED